MEPDQDPDPAEVAAGYERIIERFTAWAEGQERIRAAVVIGSRARTDHPADAWSDLDIIVVSPDRDRYGWDPAWASEIGEVRIAFTETTPDGHGVERRVLFDGGLDVDFAFFLPDHVEAEGGLASVAPIVLGRGYRTLLDRDGLVARIASAAEQHANSAAPPSAPDPRAFENTVADFWYHAVWTAKHLRRGELWWAKTGLDGQLKGLLQAMLEWDAAAAGRDPWFRGRFLEEWADPDAVLRLRDAFARYDETDAWRALHATMDLFADVARRVATQRALGYPEAAETHARELVGRYGPPSDRPQAELMAREPIFHRDTPGTAREAFEAWTAIDFWEVGASGRVYTREEVLATVAARHADPTYDPMAGFAVSDFVVRQLGQDIWLATYHLQEGDRATRRASVWRREGGEWVLLYHQGTVISDL